MNSAVSDLRPTSPIPSLLPYCRELDPSAAKIWCEARGFPIAPINPGLTYYYFHWQGTEKPPPIEVPQLGGCTTLAQRPQDLLFDSDGAPFGKVVYRSSITSKVGNDFQELLIATDLTTFKCYQALNRLCAPLYERLSAKVGQGPFQVNLRFGNLPYRFWRFATEAAAREFLQLITDSANKNGLSKDCSVDALVLKRESGRRMIVATFEAFGPAPTPPKPLGNMLLFPRERLKQ